MEEVGDTSSVDSSREELTAADYLVLGGLLDGVTFPQLFKIPAYREAVAKLQAQIARCRFDVGLVTVEELARESHALKGNEFSEAERNLVAGHARSLLGTLFGEAVRRVTIALHQNDVSGRLHDLQKLVALNDVQEELRKETVRCLECGTYRAAAVMGWNLAYDYIRQWVLDNKKVELNDGLKAVRKDGHKHDIDEYDDFFDNHPPSEMNVLDAMAAKESGPIIGSKLYDHVKQYLRHRNTYAHANSTAATMMKSNSYIENLIDIITSSPFK